MMTESLQNKARQHRKDILKMLCGCQSGHPGGSLSVVEIIMALYEHVLRYDAKNPLWAQRDRMVLSKGHGCPALYAVLADEGFFPRETLWTLRQMGTVLQGHPDMLKTPGVDASTGSLGQGMSIAVGFALAGQRQTEHFRVFCVIGDGEAQEGLVWEAAMAAAHYGLNNLTVIMDYNELQIDGPNEQVMSLGDIKDKFRAFGWDTFETDGHDIGKMAEVFGMPASDKPRFVLCHTVKGKGVSYMENAVGWHGKPINQEQFDAAICEMEVDNG
ncbi:MAG: transketolase [Eubacteriales bacterium]|nr:transketolase [Eubacteriales bacterium]MDD4710658.1 transketolase [Eubacteriales bacterium]